jgi:hypothetical protein
MTTLTNAVPVVLLWTCACTAPAAPVAPVVRTWTHEDVRPPTDHGFFDDHPALADLSVFATRVEGDDRPDHTQRGAYGVGNGRVFALQGLADPVSTLHGLIGPVYRREGRLFGDLSVEVVVDGTAETDVEAIARPRRTSLAVSYLEGGVRAWNVDVAPALADGAVPAIVRFVLLHNPGDAARQVALELEAVDPVLEDAGRSYVDIGGRWLGLGPTWAGSLGAGEERVVPLVFATGFTRDDVDATLDRAAEADLASWLDETVAWWHAFSDAGTQIDVGDPVVHDLLDGLATAVRVQQFEGGGISPMSRYTNSWLRDTIGPVRLYTRTGHFAEAEAALAYLEACHRSRGDIGNSCASGLLPEEITAEVDWTALPPLTGRVGAEGPSYLGLGWTTLADWTGDDAPLEAHWDYLERAILTQEMTDEGLQAWSGDETFRLAMNVALGFPLEHPWEALAWSSNSGFVMAGAADAMARAAARLGRDPTPYADRADLARLGLETHLLRPEGHFAALQFRDPATEPVDLPYEDAALKAIWAAAYAPDDPVALEALAGLEAVAGRGDGSFQSAPHPMYADIDDAFGVGTGVATGMLPGYALLNLVATGHPQWPDAFAQVHAYASPSGQFHEGLVYGSRAAFQPFYDVGGSLGDVAARFRPWEGGIVADATWFALLGVRPVDGGLALAPRPPGRTLRATGIRVRDAVVDLVATWDDGWRIVVTNRGPEVVVQLDWPLQTWTDGSVTTTPGSDVVVAPLGERVVRFDLETLAPGATSEFLVVVGE